MIVQESQEMAAAAAPWFSARPSRLAPVCKVMAVPATMVPFMMELAPKVMALPAVQNTLLAFAPPLKTTWLVDKVVIAVALRITNTALASPCASKVKLPPADRSIVVPEAYRPGYKVRPAKLVEMGVGVPRTALFALVKAAIASVFALLSKAASISAHAGPLAFTA